MKVRATEMGFYINRRQRPGSEFMLEEKEHFTWTWMEPVDWDPNEPMPEDLLKRKEAEAARAEKKHAHSAKASKHKKDAPEKAKKESEDRPESPSESVI